MVFIHKCKISSFINHNYVHRSKKQKMEYTQIKRTFNTTLYMFFIFFLYVIIFPLVSGNTDNQICETAGCVNSVSVFKRSINTSINPCDNFYEYACGKWYETHPTISEFVPSSTIQQRKYKNRIELKDFLQCRNNESEPVAVHKARKLFQLCMDTDAIDRKGFEPIRGILNNTGLSMAPKKDFDFIASTVKMSKLYGVDMFYMISVTPDPYNQTRNVIGISNPSVEEVSRIPTFQFHKLTEEQKSNSITTRQYIQLVLTQLCENDTSIDCVLHSSGSNSSIFETSRILYYTGNLSSVAKKLYPKTLPGETADLHSLEDLQNLTNAIVIKNNMTPINWTYNLQLYFNNVENVTLDFSKPKEIQIVYKELFIKDIINFIHSYSIEEHEVGMIWTIADTFAQYSSYHLRNLKTNYSADVTDIENRSEWCTETLSQILGMALSYYYATNEKYINIKNEVTEMVNTIHTVFRNIIITSTWIDDVTKEKALKKIDSMKKQIAFPSSLAKIEDLNEYYKNLEITDDFLESVLIKVRNDITEELNELNEVNDLDVDRRIMTSVQVNAYYDPERNTIIIPAGILGFPIYDHGLKALDYGSVGSMIGHEITHGFDSLGRRYNYIGNLEEWWANETLTKFVNRADCFTNVYQNYSMKQNNIIFTTDGLLTLTENIADNGGFKEALIAYRQYVSKNGKEPLLPGFEFWTHEQLFTLAYANLWCEHPTKLSSLISSSSDHSPNEIRVNGVVANSEEFAVIWNCTKGTNMNPNTTKCQLW